MLTEGRTEFVRGPENDPRISGSIYIPTGPVWTNEVLESWNIKPNPDSKPLTADRILQVTGIERRYQARDFETPQYIAEQLMAALLRDHQSADVVLVSNSNPQGINISEYLSREYGVGLIFNMDVHAACSGFAEELAILGENHDLFLGKKVALIAAENYQNTLEPLKDNPDIRDKSLAATIFSAGGAGIEFVYGQGLTVLGSKNRQLREDESQILKMNVDPEKMVGRFRAIDIPRSISGFFEQDGPKVYEAVRNNIPQLIVDSIYGTEIIDAETEKPRFLTAKDIKMVISHQPSIKVLDALVSQTNKLLSKRSDEPLEFFYDIKDGNFSSASALKALIIAVNRGLVTAGDKIVIPQFGAGIYGRSVVVELG